MARRLLFLLNSKWAITRVGWNRELNRKLVSKVLNRFLSVGKDDGKKLKIRGSSDPELAKDSSDEESGSGGKWKVELAWLSKALEPALQLYKWASTSTGSDEKQMTPPSSRSIAEIFNKLQLSKAGIQDWSIGDLTVGLYLIYLSQASAEKVEDVKGVQITSDVMVQELIYHIELAKGAYKDNATVLARHCMLREKNVLKFVKHSSVLRHGYYIGIDTRNKLVIFGIRGTHTVYDHITDVISTSDQEMSIEGFSTHFGTAEAAQWYIRHEMETIRKCLEKHKGFRLKIVDHSLGGAAAALLAIMIRKKSKEELGFSPDIVSAVGFATPPCVSKALAENCASYVSTVVLQDDIIPRLSVASITRLRNEILATDWMSVLEKEDLKGVVDLVTNAKQFVSSVQDLARRLTDYTKFIKISDASDRSIKKDSAFSQQNQGSDARTVVKLNGTLKQQRKKPDSGARTMVKLDSPKPEELFSPGTLYFLKKIFEESSESENRRESYTLWKREAGEHFQRILLSGNFITDHKCDSHYYALRDVLKGLPAPDDRVYF